jgi:hypothetical protein
VDITPAADSAAKAAEAAAPAEAAADRVSAVAPFEVAKGTAPGEGAANVEVVEAVAPAEVTDAAAPAAPAAPAEVAEAATPAQVAETAAPAQVAETAAPAQVAETAAPAGSAADAGVIKPTPRKGQPAKKAAPAKKTAPAKRATPAKRAAKAVKAAAAEIAPAIVEPDMETVPDDSAIPTPGQPLEGQTARPEQGTIPDDSSSVPAAGQQSAGGTTRDGDVPPATAPGEPGAVTPVPSTLPVPRISAADPASVSSVAVADASVPDPTEAWARIIADPGHAPELLALASVQMLGPRAAAWAQQIRDTYPTATPDAIARLAARQFTRFGSVSSIFAAVAGSYAPLTLLGAAALTQAQIALHIAAAYGLDPADEGRAVDLLLLSRVHPAREDAEAALTAAKDYSYESTGLTDAVWRMGKMLTAQAGAWAAVRVLNRYFPGTSLLAATLSSRATADSSAARAILFYSQLSQRSTAS